jgi:hypothetical protein
MNRTTSIFAQSLRESFENSCKLTEMTEEKKRKWYSKTLVVAYCEANVYQVSHYFWNTTTLKYDALRLSTTIFSIDSLSTLFFRPAISSFEKVVFYPSSLKGSEQPAYLYSPVAARIVSLCIVPFTRTAFVPWSTAPNLTFYSYIDTHLLEHKNSLECRASDLRLNLCHPELTTLYLSI